MPFSDDPRVKLEKLGLKIGKNLLCWKEKKLLKI